MANATLSSLPDLVSLRAITNGALKGDALPTRLKLLNWGVNDTVKGPVIVDDASMAAFAANQKALGYERVALDFEHNTVPGSPEYERSHEPRDVAGQGKPVIHRGDGLYLDEITWFKAGEKNARNYEDLSPAVKPDASGRVVFMHSAALTRNGAVHGLHFFSSAGGGQGQAPLTGRARFLAAQQRENAQPFNAGLRRHAATAPRVTRFAATVADDSPEAEAAARRGLLLDQPVIPDARVPKEIQLLPWGRVMSPGGWIEVNEDTVSLLPENQKGFSLARIPLLLPEVTDNGGNGQEETTVAEAQVAATGVPVARDGQGLFLTDLQFTAAGKAALLEYSSVTPNVWFVSNDDRTVIGIRSATLSKQDGIVSQIWPKFLALAAGKPATGISRMTTAFAKENAARNLKP